MPSYTPISPLGSGSLAIVSETPPSNPFPGMIWFNSALGIELIYFDGFWVQTGNPTVSLPTGVTAITGASHTLVTADQNYILRFTAVSSKTLIVPVVDSEFDPVVNTILTIRNANAGNLTITAESLSVTLNKAVDSEVVAPYTTAQLLYLGSNNWDIL